MMIVKFCKYCVRMTVHEDEKCKYCIKPLSSICFISQSSDCFTKELTTHIKKMKVIGSSDSY